ncbi:hypothetical protein JTB14_000448 [Gonioctena quinquepunctata]|nr:hypothetical protein JTB14_000448 [Gonioctena quinquepunctata]
MGSATVTRWMERHGLKLACHKTDAIVLKGPRKRKGITRTYGDSSIKPSKHLKYLGSTLIDNGSIGEHIRRTSKKSEEKVAALGRIIPNISGPMYDKRKAMQTDSRELIEWDC